MAQESIKVGGRFFYLKGHFTSYVGAGGKKVSLQLAGWYVRVRRDKYRNYLVYATKVGPKG